MTTENKQADVCKDNNYIPVHNAGFVGLIDIMGDDSSIVQAARVSYGKGTKTVNDDRNLIRYLLRNRHTSPIEMIELKFHIKMPIFVMRQWVRHRTASLNEYSGRYSVMSDDFYVPELDYVAGQSSQNKQGRNEIDESVSKHDKLAVAFQMSAHYEESNFLYHSLLGDKEKGDPYYWKMDSDEEYNKSKFTDDFTGVAKEMARFVLPVANYTELYWKIDLHNLFNLLRLRLDTHAQKEIRDYAEAIYTLLKNSGKIPLALEAFQDYIMTGKSFSGLEMKVLRDNMKFFLANQDNIKTQCKSAGMGDREISEFISKLE